jgi:hypothetical protein
MCENIIQDRLFITVSSVFMILILIAGCISQPIGENQSINTSQNISVS